MATTGLAQPNRLNPSAMSIADASRLLTAAGGQLVTAEMIQSDVDAGAPTNADGTINLIHYAAWIARRWDDPAFPAAFSWFDSPRYWQDMILSLREQIALMDESPLLRQF